jgi:PAS domain S-box-containing protein
MTVPAYPLTPLLTPALPRAEAASQLRPAINRLFMRRARVGLATIVVAMVLFSAVDLWSRTPDATSLLVLRLACLCPIAGVFFLLRWPRLLPYAPGIAWAIFAVGCAVTLATPTVSHVASGAGPILCVLFVYTAGAIFPWGPGVQLSATAVAVLALGINLYWTYGWGHPTITYEGAEGLAVCLIVSVLCASEVRSRLLGLMRDTVERRLAEEALRQSNRHLERRVRERIAELEAAKRDLARQIEENERAAATLRDSESLLRAIIDNSTALIFVKGLDGRYRRSNARHSQLFGPRHGTIVGKTPYDLYPAAVASRMLANDRQALAAADPVQFEEVVPQPDGEHTYLSVKFAVRDPSGKAYGICSISTDITERKRMEMALRRSQSTLSTLIDSSDEGIWALDREFRVQLLNAAARQRFPEAYGTEPQIGGDFRELLPADGRVYWGPRFRQALSGQRIVEEISVTANGASQQFLACLNPIRDTTGITGVTIFIKDITALKRAEERAREHQAELARVLRRSTMGELAAELAHEINQPIGAIANYAQGCRHRLESGKIDLAQFGYAIDQIASEVARAGEILERPQHTVLQAPARHEPIDVNQVIRDAVRAVEFRCTGVSMQLDLAEALAPGHGDSIQIEQVALNLLHNAIDVLQGMPPASRRLTVQTRRADGPAVEVLVSDTGTGLDVAVADKIFQPFVTTKTDGLGMGLAISRSIVEAHGGQLWVTSTPGQGCTFHFTLPAIGAASRGARLHTC